MSATNNLERCKIIGQLRCESALSIGSGLTSKKPSNKPDEDLSTCLEICLDFAGIPYLPASSLRGLLSSLCTRLFPETHSALFGTARGETGKAGKLRVYDARLATPMAEGQQIPWRTRNSIDPITGTAKNKHLFSFAYVPPQSLFACEFQLDRTTPAEMADFLGLLGALNARENPQARLGKGGNRSEGQVTWLPDKEEVLKTSSLASWLLDEDKPLQAYYVKAGINARQAMTNWNAHDICLALELRPSSPLLVDPKQPETRQESEPHMRFRRGQRGEHSVAVIPAASLRGLLRGHCRKILMSLLLDKLSRDKAAFKQAVAIAERLVGGLFGDTGRRSAVTLEEAIGENTDSHPQMFNAVDRFTGGVADTALYQVEAVVGGVFKAGLRIKPRYLRKHGRWWRGLLILALRDAMEEDLVIGWGKAKGYGAFAVAVDWPLYGGLLSEWGTFLAQADKLAIQAWVEALHNTLNREIESEKAQAAGGRHG